MYLIDRLTSSLKNEIPKFNVTAITRFRECPIQSILSLKSFRHIINPKPYKAMVKGTIGHNILENHLKSPNQFEKLWDMAIEEIKLKKREYEIDLINEHHLEYKIELKKRYMRFCRWERADSIPKYREIELEHKNVIGQIDRIDMDNTLIDFKFSNKTLKKNMTNYRLQLGGYAYLCEKNNIDIDQAMIVIPKKIKNDIGVLKKDMLEKEKNNFKKTYQKMLNYYRAFVDKKVEKNFSKNCFFCNVKEACQNI